MTPATVANHFRKTETSEERQVGKTASIAANIAESWMSSLAAARMSMRRPKSKSKPEPQIIELNIDDLMALDQRAEAEQLERADCGIVQMRR